MWLRGWYGKDAVPFSIVQVRTKLISRMLGRQPTSQSYPWEVTTSNLMTVKLSQFQMVGTSTNGLMSTYSQMQHLANEDLELTSQG